LSAVRRLGLAVALAAAGWAFAFFLDLTDLSRSGGYGVVATSLLAIGLFGSTYGIDLPDMRRHLGTVTLAVTVGVVVKAVLIGAAMTALLGSPVGFVLGVAVAQIDPLSVAALRERSRMSRSGQNILSAWASFDDPVTSLLVIYVSALVVALGVAPAAGSALRLDADPRTLAWGLLANLAFAAGAFVCHRGVKAATARLAGHRGFALGLSVAVLVALGAIAVWQFLLLGLAISGLFFRPAIEPALRRLVQVAFLVATVLLGMLLVDGVHLLRGGVLGAAAYLAQAAVALVIARRQPRQDRIYLALGQQNGITAIIIALLLEPTFPGVAGTVAPAILVVNLLHAAGNAVWDRQTRPVPPEPEPSDNAPPDRAPPAGPVAGPAPAQAAVPGPPSAAPARPAGW
jgi:hypothetical protein